ncbi:MAG: tetratricopeptide repeat protein [Planctomycetota bacterium]|nr:tetratricopeptide repeat protein [Planctomycetota bacterium]
MQPSAETAYLFRHALLREAAYELQPPGVRARLHELAFHLIEQLYGGRAPRPPALDDADAPPPPPHPADAVARELAGHARLARAESGELADARRLYLQRAAEAAQRACQDRAALECWLELAGLEHGAVAAEAQRRGAEAAFRTGDTARALALAEQAAQAQSENNRLQGIALGTLATVQLVAGRLDEAEQTNWQALMIHREFGDVTRQVTALGNLANVYTYRSRLADAERTYEQVLELAPSPHARSVALVNLAGVYRATARHELAETTFLRALEGFRALGDRRVEGITIGNLGTVYEDVGRHEEAEHAYRQSIAIAREVGNRRSEGAVLGNLAKLLKKQGRGAESRSALLQAVAIHHEVGNRRFEGIALGEVALLHVADGRTDDAARAFEQALAIHAEVGNRRYLGRTRCEYALLLLQPGQAEPARTLWLSGADVLRGLDHAQDYATAEAAMRAHCAEAGVDPFA